MHPMKDARRVPIKQLMNKLGVAKYDSHAGFVAREYNPKVVYIPLSQHIGTSATPVVKMGEAVAHGQLIGDIPDGKLGAKIHASIKGRVSQITSEMIIIEG